MPKYIMRTVHENDYKRIAEIYNSNHQFLRNHLGVDFIDETFVSEEVLTMQKAGFRSCIVVDQESAMIQGVLDMEYVTATSDMINAVYNVLHTAIETIYPKYYPKEVVDFFCRYHSKEHIWDGIASGNMGVLICDNAIVGTGCFEGNHITSVYVLPAYQNQGCGSYIMNCLENEILKMYDTAVLDASLPAACMYEHRGYKTVGHGIFELDNDVKLVYEIMEKKLRQS